MLRTAPVSCEFLEINIKIRNLQGQGSFSYNIRYV